DTAPESYVREKIVPPSMAHAAEAQIKINTMATIRIVISFSLLESHSSTQVQGFSGSSQKWAMWQATETVCAELRVTHLLDERLHVTQIVFECAATSDGKFVFRLR